MKLQFRSDRLGLFDGDTSKNPVVLKDEFRELTGFPLVWPRAYYLRYRFEFFNCDAIPVNNHLVQIQQISDPIRYEQFTVNKPAIDVVVDSRDSTIGNLFIRSDPASPSQSLTSSIRLRPFGCSIRYAFATTDAKGSGGDPGPRFDNLTSTITSTGYYGDAKRTLIAEIDRISGQLIGIYDFNVYAGTGNISP